MIEWSGYHMITKSVRIAKDINKSIPRNRRIVFMQIHTYLLIDGFLVT
ncbi:MAG: hypothetical protein UR22_C0011G0004 [Parcubacteria group bacterium GW2011_GWC2_32_10]|nr:MAG: hypothetical protein UR22_C0011G0004 [Parcubacteria group bacterium GW2011_GWC2_32_10]